MSGSLWSIVVAHECRRQDDSYQLSMMQTFQTAVSAIDCCFMHYKYTTLQVYCRSLDMPVSSCSMQTGERGYYWLCYITMLFETAAWLAWLAVTLISKTSALLPLRDMALVGSSICIMYILVECFDAVS